MATLSELTTPRRAACPSRQTQGPRLFDAPRRVSPPHEVPTATWVVTVTGSRQRDSSRRQIERACATSTGCLDRVRRPRWRRTQAVAAQDGERCESSEPVRSTWKNCSQFSISESRIAATARRSRRCPVTCAESDRCGDDFDDFRGRQSPLTKLTGAESETAWLTGQHAGLRSHEFAIGRTRPSAPGLLRTRAFTPTFLN